jgi:hypothetical protein
VLRLEPHLGYLPAAAVAFSATLPVLLIAGYAGTRDIDEPATMLADRFAVWMLALGPASAWPTRAQVVLEKIPDRRGAHRAADRVANHLARPSLEIGHQVDETARDRQVGQVRNPALVAAIGNNSFGQVREDRPGMVAVGGDVLRPGGGEGWRADAVWRWTRRAARVEYRDLSRP